MSSHHSLPIHSNLHLLCGADTVVHDLGSPGQFWASDMLGISGTALSVPNAWYDAGRRAYSSDTNITGTIVFRVAGWSSAFSETLDDSTNSTSGSITSTTQQVYP
jgi:hypothetical protein